MKIKIIKNAGPYKAGEIADMPDHVAQGWLAMGLAMEIEDNPQDKKEAHKKK